MFRGFRTKMLESKQRKRLHGYKQDLDYLTSGELNIKELSEELSEFWRKVRLDDLLHFTPREAMQTTLELRHKNLPELVDYLEEVNNLIAEEKDGALETLSRAHFNDPVQVVLDLYFADAKGRPILGREQLKRLQSLLLCHRSYLETQESHYYYRQCDRLYQEILNITGQLVNLAITRKGAHTTT